MRRRLRLETLESRLLLNGAVAAFDDADDWLYQLTGPGGVDLDLAPLAETDYDMFVIDYSADGDHWGEFTAAQVAALQDSRGGDRPVLSYLSIGEAENYRFYWGDVPGGVLGPANPDWPDNYPVRYWDAGWQEIFLGGNTAIGAGYLDRIIDAGFNGVYLDIVDGFEYWGPLAIGGTGERPTAATDMIDFVEAIGEYARVTRGQTDFIVVTQNGSNITDNANFPAETLAQGVTPAEEAAAQRARLFAAINGIGAEDTFHYGDEDNNNPLDVQADALANLDMFAAAGEKVLTVDYISPDQSNPFNLQFPAAVDDLYTTSRQHGFVPFATVRDLDLTTVNPTQPPNSRAGLIYDLDDSGSIGTGDYSFFTAAWNSQAGDVNWNASADFDADGQVNVADYTLLAGAWHKDTADPAIPDPADPPSFMAPPRPAVRSLAVFSFRFATEPTLAVRSGLSLESSVPPWDAALFDLSRAIRRNGEL
jgi:uncharacterized protein (TIGR01370 family)